MLSIFSRHERGLSVLSLLAVWLGLTPVPPAVAGQGGVVPFRLMVLNYDAKLDAVLVSGEFQNALDAPLRAFRGVLELTPGSGAPIVLRFDCGARRPVPPAQWSVCSTWIEIADDDATLQALKAAAGTRPDAELRMSAVLFVDGRQQAF